MTASREEETSWVDSLLTGGVPAPFGAFQADIEHVVNLHGSLPQAAHCSVAGSSGMVNELNVLSSGDNILHNVFTSQQQHRHRDFYDLSDIFNSNTAGAAIIAGQQPAEPSAKGAINSDDFQVAAPSTQLPTQLMVPALSRQEAQLQPAHACSVGQQIQSSMEQQRNHQQLQQAWATQPMAMLQQSNGQHLGAQGQPPLQYAVVTSSPHAVLPSGINMQGMLQPYVSQQQALNPSSTMPIAEPADGLGSMLFVYQPLAGDVNQEQLQQLRQQQQQQPVPAAAHAAQPKKGKGGRARVGDGSSDRLLTKSGDASRRYRERQKNLLGSLEAEVAEKLQQLQLLTAENELLKLRASVLEATVASREDQMQVVQEHGPPVYVSDHSKPLPSGDEAQTEQKEAAAAAHKSSIYSPELAAAATMATGLAGGGQGLGQTVNAPAFGSASESRSPGAIGVADIGAGADSAAAVSSSDGCSGGNSNAFKSSKMCPETIKEMDTEDIARHWKQFLREFSKELVRVQQEEAAHGSAAAAAAAAEAHGVKADADYSASNQRLKELTDRALYLFKVASSLNPVAYCQLYGRHLDTGAQLQYSDEQWREVMGHVNFSASQERHLLACAELYFPSVEQLQEQRRALQQQLQASGLEDTPLCALSAAKESPVQLLLDALDSNLKKEHVLRLMLHWYVWGEILTPLQKARAGIYSHPLFPDVHAMTCVLVKDRLAARAKAGQQPRFVFPHRHNMQQVMTMLQQLKQQHRRGPVQQPLAV